MTAFRLSLPRRVPRWHRPTGPLAPGIAAIIVKELRGRMRGRRTFAIVTIYLVLLAGFGWMLERMNETSLSAFGGGGICAPDGSCVMPGFDGQTFAATSASIGQGIFAGLMMLLTLVVAVLAPASTAGAISGERERQTLDLLTVTPITSPAIVLGKLVSALAWVFVLILASIPVTALVFVFGGVAPDDLLRSYAVLLATAVAMGSIGLFFSALLRRTGASTGLTYVAMLVLTVGSVFVWEFLYATGSRNVTGLPKPPPQAVLYLNPFIAQADVACGTQGGFGSWCGVVGAIADGNTDLLTPLLSGNQYVGRLTIDANFSPPGLTTIGGGKAFFPPNAAGGIDAAGPDSVTVGSGLQDQLWRRSVLSFLALAAVLTFLSVQLVSPSRRWRPRRPTFRGRVRAEETADA
jgi:ABC-2 type transport system permease protein